MLGRVIACALVVLAAGCAKDSNGNSDPVAAARATTLQATAQGATAGSRQSGAMAAVTIPARAGLGFAHLPDHGQLLAYPGNVVRRQGAYTWHRADLSEAYALRAIHDGHLQVTAPDGQALDFKYDRHVEHASGDWTWIGHRAGHELEQAVLTFGANAAFGSIAQPDKHALRLTVRDGVSWLVETDPAKLADAIDKMTSKPDFMLASKPRRSGIVAQGAAAMPSGATTQAAGDPLVDVVLGYTPGFAAANGGNSGAVTRLNFLVDFANTAYFNSQLNGRVRLVAAIPVNYPDNNSNNDTLEKLSGFQAPSTYITPDPAFNALRAARETYGADLVSLVRKFQTPENESCGVAWLLGGGKQGIDLVSGWDDLGYAVVSDGVDRDETDSKNYYCEDHTLAHELGHNMGLAHDRETAEGDDGVLDNPDDYGAYDYSFGYKKSAPAGLYDVMAYGDTGQTSYNIFSNPRVTFCGGQPCGIAAGQANAADASLSLSQTMPTIAKFRATKVPTTPGQGARHDVDGDGKSDLLWSRPSTSSYAHWVMNGATITSSKGFSIGTAFTAIGSGDFDGNGHADVIWRNSSGDIYVWLGSGTAYTSQFIYRISTGWTLVGTDDANGDGKSDLLWSRPSTGSFAHWVMNGATITSSKGFSIGTAFTAIGSGDFDGNGHADVIWRNSSGDLYVWLGSGTAYTSQFIYRLGSGWKLAGTDDVNGDGKSDLLWSKPSTGSFAHWVMNGATIASSKGFSIGSAFTAIGSGDFDGNGHADVIWRNSSGDIYAWLGSGTAYTSQYIYRLASGWSLVP